MVVGGVYIEGDFRCGVMISVPGMFAKGSPEFAKCLKSGERVLCNADNTHLRLSVLTGTSIAAIRPFHLELVVKIEIEHERVHVTNAWTRFGSGA